MDGELVSSSPSEMLGAGEKENSPHYYTYSEQFNEMFPYYLSIGMTEEQYWDKDPTLTIAYRKAQELRNKQKNYELWLQGLYVYEAICDVSPILHAFAKKGTKPHQYTMQPYPLTEKDKEQVEIDKEKRIAEKGKMLMESFMKRTNKKFSKQD